MSERDEIVAQALERWVDPAPYDAGVYTLAQHPSRWAEQWDLLRPKTQADRAARAVTTVLGLDVSLRSTGATILESPSGDSLSVTIAPNPALPFIERLRAHRDGLYALLRGWEPLPVLALVESGYSGGRGPSADVLAMVRGAYVLALDDLYIRTYFAAPRWLKKFATGDGNATKDEVLAAAVSQLGFERSGERRKDKDADYDRADSLWLAHAAGFIVGESFQPGGTNYFDEQVDITNKLEDFALERMEDHDDA